MSLPERVLLSFPIGLHRFNYRVAGIAMRDGHVLVCREDEDAYTMLPGGRVELGEGSDLALAREMAEELAMPVEIGRLLLTSESFYEREDQHFHELCFFYEITLPPDAGPNGQRPWLSRADEGHMLHFDWVPLAGNGLQDVNLLPAWLQTRLPLSGQGVEHVIYRSASAQ